MKKEEILYALDQLETRINRNFDNKFDELRAEVNKQGILLEAHISDQRDLVSIVVEDNIRLKNLDKKVDAVMDQVSVHGVILKNYFQKAG